MAVTIVRAYSGEPLGRGRFEIRVIGSEGKRERNVQYRRWNVQCPRRGRLEEEGPDFGGESEEPVGGEEGDVDGGDDDDLEEAVAEDVSGEGEGFGVAVDEGDVGGHEAAEECAEEGDQEEDDGSDPPGVGVGNGYREKDGESDGGGGEEEEEQEEAAPGAWGFASREEVGFGGVEVWPAHWFKGSLGQDVDDVQGAQWMF